MIAEPKMEGKKMNPNKEEYSKKGIFDKEVWSNALYYFKESFKEKPSVRNIDLGCGSGKKADYIFGKNNWHGIDFSEESVAHELCDLNVVPWGLSVKKADYILACGVLEHLYSPYLALREIHKMLCDGGKCFIMIPSVDNRTTDDIVPHHFYYFSEKGFEILLRTVGFKEVNFFYNGPFKNNLLDRFLGDRDIYCEVIK